MQVPPGIGESENRNPTWFSTSHRSPANEVYQRQRTSGGESISRISHNLRAVLRPELQEPLPAKETAFGRLDTFSRKMKPKLRGRLPRSRTSMGDKLITRNRVPTYPVGCPCIFRVDSMDCIAVFSTILRTRNGFDIQVANRFGCPARIGNDGNHSGGHAAAIALQAYDRRQIRSASNLHFSARMSRPDRVTPQRS